MAKAVSRSAVLFFVISLVAAEDAHNATLARSSGPPLIIYASGCSGSTFVGGVTRHLLQEVGISTLRGGTGPPDSHGRLVGGARN